MPENRFLKNYGFTLLLLLGLVAGGVLGAVWKGCIPFLRPIGNLFLNMMFVLVVPLVFFSVAQSMVSMRRSGVIGKVLGTSLCVFLFMSLAAGTFSYLLAMVWNPFEHMAVAQDSAAGSFIREEIDRGDALVATFSVSDFPLLFSREHLLPLIIFSSLFGLAIAFLGKEASTVEKFISEGGAVIMKMMEMVMKFAPVGLGCYFAETVGSLGGKIAGDYLEIFLMITVAVAVCYFVFSSLYALFCGVPLGKFWKELIQPSATAIGTCSSAACMPVSMASAKRLGVSDKIVDGVIPLGTNLHKDGSIVASIAKILFALHFFRMASGGIGMAVTVILLGLLESIVVGAIPVGGMTGELLICAVLGLDPSFAATLLIISTITDIPDTLLNATGNLVAPLLVERLTGRKQSPKG